MHEFGLREGALAAVRLSRGMPDMWHTGTVASGLIIIGRRVGS